MNAPLNRSSVSASLLLNHKQFDTGIVHIGLGNFHRAHFAVYTAKAMERSGGNWGICAYSFRNKDLVNALQAQDNLYSVLEIGPDTESAYIPNAHTEFVVGYENAPYVSNVIASLSTKIISLTVTEAGYLIDQATGGLNWQDQNLINDLGGKSPRSIYGLILNGLRARNQAPITILSCDNISHNGDLLKKLLIEYVSKAAPELLSYLETQVSFPNSMVDRIVPGTEQRHLEISEARLKLKDLAPVPCERFSMWAVEDKFIAGRPDWSEVIFTDQVNEFEMMKLMLLNGSHSLLAYLGGLLNCATIPDCRFNPNIEKALRKALTSEFLPAVTMPSGIHSDAYISDLFTRWSNTVLGDKTYRVGTDGSTKLPQRITKPALLALRNGKTPDFMALIVASWMACMVQIGQEISNDVIKEMKDPNKELMQSLPKSNCAEFVQTFFNQTNIFNDEISSSSIFKDLIIRYRNAINENGINKAIELALLST